MLRVCAYVEQGPAHTLAQRDRLLAQTHRWHLDYLSVCIYALRVPQDWIMNVGEAGPTIHLLSTHDVNSIARHVDASNFSPLSGAISQLPWSDL